MTRNPLNNRRPGFASDLEHGGAEYRMQSGHYPDGRAGEMFLDSRKPNSALDAFAADGAILVSLLLQHQVSLEAIAHALRRDPNGAPATVIGAAVDRLIAETRQR